MRMNRTPAIWRADSAASPVEAPDHAQLGGRVFISWRAISALIAAAMIGILVWMFTADEFYIQSVRVTGLNTLSARDVARLAGIERLHLFWVDPAQVEQTLLTSPVIASARVTVEMPPEGVHIVIQEREPALVWEQGGESVWVDVGGRVMEQRQERSGLLRIVADPLVEGEAPPALDLDIVTGALQLSQLIPNLSTLRYHPDKGLGYNDPRGWEVWFGAGTDMPQKVIVYDAVVADLARRGIVFRELNVTDPDQPVYCCRGN
jgi:cell division septal protein FtsQ